MTTFVVSLFLPYTIDFHDLPEEAPPRSLADIGRTDSTRNVNASQASLLSGVSQSPLPTPSIAEHSDFFSQSPTVFTHFPKGELKPNTLVRSDSHVPEGSAGLLFNQPRSRADPPPPATILEYVKAQDASRARPRNLSPHATNRNHRDRSVDPRWATDWTVVPAVQGNGGLTNAVRAALDTGSMSDVLHVGLIGFPTDVLDAQKKTEIHEKLESEHESLTVFVSDQDYDGHYAHYCKTILWPVFHYQIPDHPKSKAFEDHSFKYYVSLNQAFADKVIANYKRGDIIWIHDYHLLLVPKMIREKLPDAQIGFFLHTAFPSSEVFRCLASRDQLLEGLLGANLVAFQIDEYAHHFLQTCSRILSVEATEDGLQLDNRFVNVFSCPIGIDPKALAVAREEGDVAEWIKKVQDRYAGKRLIVARDKLDNIRGVRQKLLAYELFLNKYPEYKDKVVLIQVATSTTDNDSLASTVSEIVTRIEAVHSTLAHQPLVFLRQDISFSQYLALLSVADTLMITSLREGMNLTCHEFVICQDGEGSSKKHSPVILSEFTGSAAIFEGTELAVNPWDYQKCAEAIKVALDMPDDEKDRRYIKLRDIVMHHTGESWIRNLTEQLATVHDEHFRRDMMSIPRLSHNKLIVNYKSTNKRLFLLDYEGTLTTWGNVSKTVLASPQRVIDALNDLLADNRNIVYIMSGLTMDELEMIFSRVPGLGLIAENGCFLKEARQDGWIAFADMEKTNKWKESVRSILQYYIERVENSHVEDRRCSLIFHYKKDGKVDEAASRQAGDCANHINDACENQRVRAIPTKDSVIIEPIDWDKGTAAKYIMAQLGEEDRPEFLFVAGNDRDDEVVFRWAKTVADEGGCANVETVTVGTRNTVAMATLTQGTTGLINVLNKLAKL
ncbi:glycosyltransferase family 20 protein [Amniculicola lignicola CBS 123094]|uniref:Glycosyltransferase family 20 protein n=1 Tax=Amniculicola lignicola CBS 123094 TaxID=1392246 RepID=A0A6A5WWI7_9PLEO|nr:glycosyltransferase family 20 protein [Amniculicola lignicola CBS 123094]